MLRLMGRSLVGIAAAAGAVTASQFPEFAQQYRQRLGGAVDEMKQVVSDFDANAIRSGLTREGALERYERSDESFLRNQGANAKQTVDRYERLLHQQSRLDGASPYARPVIILSYPDPRIVRGAWSDYEPSVPVTPSGLVWAALGFFIAGGAISLIRQVLGIAWRRIRSSQAHPSASPPASSAAAATRDDAWRAAG